MKAELKAQYLHEYIGIIKTLVDEAIIDARTDGLHGRIVDSAHIAIIEINLPKSAFEKYELEHDENIGLDLEKIIDKSLRKIQPEQIISMQTAAKNPTTSYIIFKDRNIAYTFEQKDTNGITRPKVPSLNLPAWAVMPVDELKRACKAASDISDNVILKIGPEGFVLSAEGVDDEIEYKPPLASTEFGSEGKTYKSMFPIKYFGSLIAAIPNSQKQVKLYLYNDFPVKIEYNLSNGSSVMCLIAPRIETP